MEWEGSEADVACGGKRHTETHTEKGDRKTSLNVIRPVFLMSINPNTWEKKFSQQYEK